MLEFWDYEKLLGPSCGCSNFQWKPGGPEAQVLLGDEEAEPDSQHHPTSSQIIVGVRGC